MRRSRTAIRVNQLGVGLSNVGQQMKFCDGGSCSAEVVSSFWPKALEVYCFIEAQNRPLHIVFWFSHLGGHEISRSHAETLRADERIITNPPKATNNFSHNTLDSQLYNGQECACK
jgi:hypothetical protein